VSRAPKDGRILGSGVVKAAEIATGLGLGGPEPDVKPTQKLTPAQARAQAEGKPLPPSPEGFETVTIKGGQDAWEHLGRPALENPPGTPDGSPLPVIEERPPTAEPQRVDWEKIDRERDSEAQAPSPAEAAEQLRQDARAHVERQIERVKQANASGDPDRKRRAAEEAEASASVVRKVLAKIGGAE